MDRETRKACEASIAHWYRISACETKDELRREGYFSEECALCQMFDNESSFVSCRGCPVSQATGVGCCDRSPYQAASFSLTKWLHTGEWYNTDQDNIEAEIRFLESLL